MTSNICSCHFPQPSVTTGSTPVIVDCRQNTNGSQLARVAHRLLTRNVNISAMANNRNYYTNPAFCQQSEYPPKTTSTPRQSPIGAQASFHVEKAPIPGPKPKEYGEQEFYEEIVVDEEGFVKEKKIVVLTSPKLERKRIVNRYEEVPQVLNHTYNNGHRYEYIPDVPSPQTSPKRPTIKDGYALVRKNDRYELLPLEKISDTYRYHSPQKAGGRYQMIADAPDKSVVATRKLQELLSTPQKKVIQKDPFTTSPTTPRRMTSGSPPKAQQRLNYAIGTRCTVPENKRHTAIIAPMCSNPYGETTYYTNRTESWMNLSMSKGPVQATLTAAAVLMVLCGAVTSGLCFYMVSVLGRLYYLDFGIVAGFTCLILGLLGFRSRHCYWLPNRNYISGYIILSVFSLLTSAGLLVLLIAQPKPGTPLADMTSGAVCGISALSLVLAAAGVVASYCCRYPPPDNRVEHCARGFTV